MLGEWAVWPGSLSKNSFNKQLKAQKKLMLPMEESNEIMERILDEVTAEKLDDFVKL